MDTPFSDMEAMRREITRLSQTIETLKKDAPNASYSRNHTSDLEDDFSPTRQNYNLPPSLYPYDSIPHKPHAAKRKEIEVRRYNGKEPVNEYLLQFELTSKRNAWTDAEKAAALLCALDGAARSILSEIDNVDNIAFDEIKLLLKTRFGPVQLTDIHEQALGEIRLTRGVVVKHRNQRVSGTFHPHLNPLGHTGTCPVHFTLHLNPPSILAHPDQGTGPAPSASRVSA